MSEPLKPLADELTEIVFNLSGANPDEVMGDGYENSWPLHAEVRGAIQQAIDRRPAPPQLEPEEARELLEGINVVAIRKIFDERLIAKLRAIAGGDQ